MSSWRHWPTNCATRSPRSARQFSSSASKTRVPAYNASKHGVVGLTRQLAITHADKGITVNAIGPGAIQTNLRANTVKILGADAPVMRGIGGDDAAVRAITPAGRRGTLEEVAATAVFLASREASYVTGHTLMVDGGWIAR